MKEKRFFLAFDGVERGIMINCLNKVRKRFLLPSIPPDILYRASAHL